MIKAVFFDIDGTLIDKHSKVLDSTREAIRKLQKAGILCGIATGRGPLAITDDVKKLAFDVMVTYNGQYVYTKNEVIYSNPMLPNILKKIAKYADEQRLPLFFGAADETAGNYFLQMGGKNWLKGIERLIPKKIGKKLMAPLRLFSKKTSQKRKPRYKYQGLSILEKPIYQCVALCSEKETKRLEQAIPECSFTRSNPYTVDIMPKGGSKIHGIREAIAFFEIPLQETMAFGDSWNDEEMLRQVGIGIAMGNAQEDIQALADDVTDTHNDHGIMKALLKHHVLKESGINDRKN